MKIESGIACEKGKYKDFSGIIMWGDNEGVVENATFELEVYHGFKSIIFCSGIWVDGVLDNGYWFGGIWENGTWNDGYWLKGTWENGMWESGDWEVGTWKDGVWKDGVWERGTWKIPNFWKGRT